MIPKKEVEGCSGQMSPTLYDEEGLYFPPTCCRPTLVSVHIKCDSLLALDNSKLAHTLLSGVCSPIRHLGIRQCQIATQGSECSLSISVLISSGTGNSQTLAGLWTTLEAALLQTSLNYWIVPPMASIASRCYWMQTVFRQCFK